MSDEFEPDVFGGEGMPTEQQIVLTRDYLKRHNRESGIRPTQKELTARGFTISIASVGRALREGGKAAPRAKESEVKKAADRNDDRRNERRQDARKPRDDKAGVTLADVELDEDQVAKIQAIVKDETLTSTALAIMENRHRMALNVVIAQAMAAKPNLLILDMRGTAALVDALTVAAKLSGGASIDIHIPTEEERRNAQVLGGESGNGISPGGHLMKDVTPVQEQSPSGMLSDLEAFRAARRKNGS